MQPNQKPLGQTCLVSERSITYGIRQFPLFPAIAVSVILHSVTLALWTDAFFSHQDNIPQSIPVNRPTAINTLTVALTSLPAQPIDNSQHPLPVPNKQNEPTRPIPKKLIQAKSEEPGQARKSAVLGKQPAHIKKTKVTQQKAAKAAVQRPVIKQEQSPNTDQRIGMRKKVTVSDTPNSFIAKSTTQTQAFERPLVETTAKNSNAQATNNKQPSSVPQLANSKLTSNLPTTNSLLPPLLKSTQPDYPEEARWEERTGKVTVKFKISGQGRVINPNVTHSSGHRDLDLAAIQAIQVWQFGPEKGQTGNPWYHYSFRFELN